MSTRNSIAPDLPGLSIVRERTRTIIAYVAVGVFFGLVVLIVLLGWGLLRTNIEDIVKLLSAVSGVLSGIVGAIVGFYFRSED